MALILDTGVLYAALDRRDSAYERCRRLLEETNEPLVVPAVILPEVDYLLTMRARPEALLDVLNDMANGAYTVGDLHLEDYRRVRDICARYHDSDIGFVDAAVLAIVERVGEDKLATLDHRHFSVLRPRHVDSLRLLPE